MPPGRDWIVAAFPAQSRSGTAGATASVQARPAIAAGMPASAVAATAMWPSRLPRTTSRRWSRAWLAESRSLCSRLLYTSGLRDPRACMLVPCHVPIRVWCRRWKCFADPSHSPSKWRPAHQRPRDARRGWVCADPKGQSPGA